MKLLQGRRRRTYFISPRNESCSFSSPSKLGGDNLDDAAYFFFLFIPAAVIYAAAAAADSFQKIFID